MADKEKTGITSVAMGKTGEVVNFAQWRAFSSAEKISPVPASAPLRSLQGVLAELLDNEINAGLQTFAFDSFRVWIGDEMNGFDATAEFTPEDPAWADDAAVAHWLHETAIRLFPESDYAKKHASFGLQP
jgi:hypothetical protein